MLSAHAAIVRSAPAARCVAEGPSLNGLEGRKSTRHVNRQGPAAGRLGSPDVNVGGSSNHDHGNVGGIILVAWDSECGWARGDNGYVGGRGNGVGGRGSGLAFRVNKFVPCAMPTGSSRPLSMPLSNQSRWEDDVTSSLLDLKSHEGIRPSVGPCH